MVSEGMADARVVSAIETLGGSVTASAVSLASGVSIDDTEDELRALMAKVGGDYEFSGEGADETVRFKFPPNLSERVAVRHERRPIVLSPSEDRPEVEPDALQLTR